MGAPKQKWTVVEEEALKAGVLIHGAGKWRTILKDPEYSGVLYMRSNVDLKDKWRNMGVMANGWGSRDKNRLAIKKMQQSSKQKEATSSASDVPQSDEEMIDVKLSTALNVSTTPPAPLVNATPKKSIMRLDNLIMEALRNLKEPGGSNKTDISSFIEDQYWAPADFKRTLSTTLRFLTSSGKLIRAKRNYRITPYPAFSDQERILETMLEEGRQSDRVGVSSLTQSQIHLDLAKIRSLRAEEAAACAARAVAEAEVAIAEADNAAREAEAAEADAHELHAFAEVAMRMLRRRTTPKMQMVRAAMEKSVDV